MVQLITFSTDMMPIWNIWINYYINKIRPEFFYDLVDYVSRFSKNNVKSVIHISNFVKENCWFKKKGINEYVIYPSVINNIPYSK